MRTRRQFDLLTRPWSFKLLETAAPLAGYPRVKRLIPWFQPHDFTVSCIPINQDIGLPESTPLPAAILEDFITRASHRVIVDYCACRKAFECRRYPAEIGCLMMGSAALQIGPQVSREVSVEEALAHARKAMDAGLIPLVGKVRLDNLVFGIHDNRHMLSTCFCCECCCISRYARHVPASMRSDHIVPLDGLEITVTDDCDGCGACAKRCFLEVITIQDGRAVIGEGCAGCGRCATFCKRDAITITLDNSGFLAEARNRIGALVDFE
jgi:ferredoxin